MIRQLSVFVENKPGSLMEVTSRLNEAHVNIRAVASFDTPEFGILRLVVDQPEEAKAYLTSKGFVVRIRSFRRPTGKSGIRPAHTKKTSDPKRSDVFLCFRVSQRKEGLHFQAAPRLYY